MIPANELASLGSRFEDINVAYEPDPSGLG